MPSLILITEGLREGITALSSSGGLLVARLLLIVSRTEPARYTYLKHVFANDIIDVIFDRRVIGRRQRQEPVAADKRRGDRRERDITKDLRTSGWALVRH